MIKVILKEKVKGLGEEGRIIEVKDGSARNYLLPKKLALEATKFNIVQLENEKKKMVKRLEGEKEAALKLAEKIRSISCTIAVESQADDSLYGAITSQDIERSLREEGLDIEKKQVLLDEPIKKLGVYQIPVRVHPEVTSSIKVWVVKK